MIRLQLNREALQASMDLMVNEVIDATLSSINGENPENITDIENFQRVFGEHFQREGIKLLPKGFLENFELKFDFQLDFQTYQVKVDYQLIPKR
jgi:hypothetical protein